MAFFGSRGKLVFLILSFYSILSKKEASSITFFSCVSKVLYSENWCWGSFAISAFVLVSILCKLPSVRDWCTIRGLLSSCGGRKCCRPHFLALLERKMQNNGCSRIPLFFRRQPKNLVHFCPIFPKQEEGQAANSFLAHFCAESCTKRDRIFNNKGFFVCLVRATFHACMHQSTLVAFP
jgi:hypothetical protein